VPKSGRLARRSAHKFLRAFRANHRIGIFAAQHFRHAHREIFMEKVGQRALGRLVSRAVGVEAEHHFLHVLPELVRLPRRERRALRRDHILHAGLERRDQVELPLAHDRRGFVDQRALRFVQPEEHRALGEKHRLRRVHIFRRLRIGLEHAAAEGDHFAGVVADREHHAVAKTIVKRILNFEF